MGRRGILLVALIGVAVAVSSCGRASQGEIDQALGITPTATASAAQLATGTAAAAATTTAQTAVAAARSGTATGPDPAAQVALGDVSRGNLQFITQCSGCHRAGGTGPDLLSAGSAGAGITAETLLPLIRDGTGHAVPPGPYPTTLLSDGAVADIAAYIAAQAGP